MLNVINQYFTELGTIGLALNSCIESFFLVPPPDFLLIAMDLKEPQSALYFAFICTIASAIGGAIGYFIGRFGGRPVFDWLFGLISKNGNKKAIDQFEKVETLYNKYGAQAVFFAAFTPIPYKVFTIASGILRMNFWAFMGASFVGRGLRFFVVSTVLMIFGEKIKDHIEFVIVGATVVIVAFFYVLYKKRNAISKIEASRAMLENTVANTDAAAPVQEEAAVK